MEVSKQIKNSSAIASWSGFIYQGKIALYHCIQLLIDKDLAADHLKVETLDDFVIYDSEDNALSLHQVKARNDCKRSGYVGALQQAAEVSAYNISNDTKRWFHVAQELDDLSSYQPVDEAQCKVEFYTYRNSKQYLELANVDTELEAITAEYLKTEKLSSSDFLIQHKLGLLYTLFDKTVISAHAKMHEDGEIKFDAADKMPITLNQIKGCLASEVLNENDECMILNRFRRNILERTDKLIDSHGTSSDISITDVLACRNAVAKMDDLTLKRLYFSKDPSSDSIVIEGFSDSSVDNYMDIIALIDNLIIREDLPHYYQRKMGTYLPTAIHIKRVNEEAILSDIQNNVEALRENSVVQDVLYDYNNLIVDMKDKAFSLSEKTKLTGKFFNVSEDEIDKDNSRLIKINNIRFISPEDAQEELK